MAQAILLKNVENVGERGDVIDVSSGYLRNFLLPRKLAQAATPGAIAEANLNDGATYIGLAAQSLDKPVEAYVTRVDRYAPVQVSHINDAMAKYPRVFSSVYVAMIRAGEAGGFLDVVLGQIADFRTREADLKGKVKAAMIYPIILGILITSKAWFGSPWMPPIKYVPIWVDPFYNLSMLIWPALATGYRYSAVATRMTRSAMLEVLREDYVRTARAKGVFQKLVIRRHALRNALLPVITVIGIEFAFLMGGLVVTEQVFNLNGLGKLFVESVSNQDYNMTQALVMLVVAIFALANLFVDVLYAWIDPRIRYNP